MLKDGKHYDKIVLAKFSGAAALSDDKTDGQGKVCFWDSVLI